MESGLKNQSPTLTGGQITMSAWTRVIESFDAIPDAYKNSYKTVLGDRSTFPYTILAPIIPSVRFKSAEKLLSEIDNTIYIWERRKNKVDVTAYPIATISDLELGSVLLYSWLTISGVTKSGTPSSTTIEFNTATERHYARFIDKMRPASVSVEEGEKIAEQDKFDYLSIENFKFMNFGRKSFVDGEKVLQNIWQPKICKPRIVFAGRTLYQTTLTLAHLTILTDKELIIIQDDERGIENRGVRYGGKWNYIGLDHVASVEIMNRADDLLALSLTLSPGTRRLEFIFAASQKEKLNQLKKAIEKMK